MTLAQLLTENHIIPALAARDRWSAIREMASHLFALAEVPVAVQPQLLGRLHDRENRQTTGIGGGVAIPHALVPGIKEVHAVLARSEAGLDFEALDAAPVHLVVMFLVPEANQHLRLETLAAIGKALANNDFRTQLLSATSAREMREVLSGRPSGATRLLRP